MAQKPIANTLIGGKGNRQRLWDAMRLHSDTWTRAEISNAAKVNSATANSYLQGLLAAGYIVVDHVEDPGRRGATQGNQYYRLVRNVGVEAPRVSRKGEAVTQGLAQEQMWRTLRMLKTDCNAHELAAHASTAQVTVSRAAAADYLRNLDVAGYLDTTREERKNPRLSAGSQTRRYRLKPARNTGPKPPMVCRTQAVFDPNENRVVWQPEITEEDAIYG